MKCNHSRPGFELVSPCPFPTTLTITSRAPPQPSDGEAPVLELWGMWSIPSLPLLSDSLWPRMILPVRVLSMGQIELFNHLLYLKPFNCGQTHGPSIVWIYDVTNLLFIYESHTHTHTHTYIYIYIYVCVCVCKANLALNNQQVLICHKTQPTNVYRAWIF